MDIYQTAKPNNKSPSKEKKIWSWHLKRMRNKEKKEQKTCSFCKLTKHCRKHFSVFYKLYTFYSKTEFILLDNFLKVINLIKFEYLVTTATWQIPDI